MKKSLVFQGKVWSFRLTLVPIIVSAAPSESKGGAATSGEGTPAVVTTVKSARSAVTTVKGSAYGFRADISLFGGPPSTRGPEPTVTLPPGGGSVSANAPTGRVVIGPFTAFSSGPVTVSSQGTIGNSGSVTSSANIENLNTSQQEVFTAQNVSSTCTASEAVPAAASARACVVQPPEPPLDGPERACDA